VVADTGKTVLGAGLITVKIEIELNTRGGSEALSQQKKTGERQREIFVGIQP
jgi:hypothetical protein